jgi:circadian clock protein KaiC
VLLDNRVVDQVSTRRLRVVKYRGSIHGADEYPFLIGEHGISVFPVTSLGLTHNAGTQRISSGIPRLDTMLGGTGFYRGSSILVSGTAGSGKTTLAAKLVAASCARGERAMYFAFEESPGQILRNMRSVGIHLDPLVSKGLLRFHAVRPTYYGLEMHLVTIHDAVKAFRPRVVVIDPLTNLTEIGSKREVKAMLTRLIDFLKTQQVTAMFTSLTEGGANLDQSEIGVSSLMDSWIVVRNVEQGGERNRALYVLKGRGLDHSNQVREFIISDKGVDLVDVYTGDGEVLFGSARLAQKEREQQKALEQKEQTELRRLNLTRHRKAVEAQIAALRSELHAREEVERLESSVQQQRQDKISKSRQVMARQRSADAVHEN